MERTLVAVSANNARGFCARGWMFLALWQGILEAAPAGAVAIFAVCQIVLWTALPLLLSKSMPLDVVSDMLPWGHEWQWGYYKHPPLPAWLAEAAFSAAGGTGVYLLSQVFIALTLLVVFRLGCRMLAPKYAAAGTLLVAGIYYFSVPTPEFNNNVAQMPFWAGAAYALYCALNDGRLRYWIALGLALGLGLLCKYSTVMLVAAMLAYALSASPQRQAWKTAGPYATALVAALVFLPNFIWLIEHRFIALDYAQSRAGIVGGLLGSLAPSANFVLAQAIDHAPALAIAAASGVLGRGFGKNLTLKQREDFRFLLFIGIGPAVFSIAASLFFGLGLRTMWGAPMWNLSGLILMLGAASYERQIALKRLHKFAGLAFLCGLCAYALAVKVVPDLRGQPSRLSWPASRIARTFAKSYAQRTGDRIRIVGGDEWLAGLIAMRLPVQPSVFSQNSFAAAPWITPERLAREGMLVVWRNSEKKNASAPRIAGLEYAGSYRFVWPRGVRALPLIVEWGIVPPRGAQHPSTQGTEAPWPRR
ncbi:MAG TPA: glycosyltransferase family 39 protein [Rhizomicrobium sp.]|nr:glycosyltransferase family 39 protein [Rhizomicrobium sp.]